MYFKKRRICPSTLPEIFTFHNKPTTIFSKFSKTISPNHNNVSEWSDMSTRGLLFQRPEKFTFSRHDIAEKLLNWREATNTIPLNTHFLIYLSFCTLLFQRHT
jgi:hypothetical protein